MLKFQIEHSLRYRVAVALATFSIFIVGTLCIILYFASDKIEEAHIEQVIQMEMDHLVHRYQKHSDFISHVGSHLKSYVIHDMDDELQIPAYLRGFNAGYHRIYYGPEDFHVLVHTIDEVKFLVAYRIALHKQRLSKLRWLIIMSWVAVVAIAFVVGYLLAGMLVKQVSDLAERVSLLAPGDVQIGLLTQPDMDEEVAQLARALDDYQNRIERMLQREQEFTANISHELRTPITTILTSCELLNTIPDLPVRACHRIKMIESAATRMGEQLQALLFLAREQALGVMEPVAIAECVFDAVEPICGEIYRKKLKFEVSIAPEITLTLNRQALHTALMNLLRNAVQYTESGFIRVEFNNQRLSISDSGIGIEPAYLPLLYERFFRGSTQGQGLGIGLAIVKRICNHYGWGIEVDSTPGQGTTFHIIFN
ncbi:HAMP domain-containing sensor histidine kinase [Nitrosomonas sp.]|uniref:sensor histidine kinase n=1 Tax=Nitrosomonas sp. TaxID=42353 RepID=UPI001B5BB5F5|nr:HAMP domain-containing sensor histidine kinase [Nitrosomonas sp.]MBK9662163.1 HAMP domain-containing histidine kinase [Nitrosomonas sp.]MBP6355047.1 HAMP domain-containing histidine kinase [Nitrosomonas sp.]MBP9870769.1 HAMP domain-containing histidine kinase [Nitrosomonas sp.]MDO8333529.1 HAMP domain-containing sensor histidine kinase [Nitrosomonas sp.]